MPLPLTALAIAGIVLTSRRMSTRDMPVTIAALVFAVLALLAG